LIGNSWLRKIGCLQEFLIIILVSDSICVILVFIVVESGIEVFLIFFNILVGLVGNPKNLFISVILFSICGSNLYIVIIRGTKFNEIAFLKFIFDFGT